jgi:hypothetical protein
MSSAPRIAASTVSRPSSYSSGRTAGQEGMPALELTPGPSGVPGQPLPPVSNGVGIANMRSLPIFR